MLSGLLCKGPVARECSRRSRGVTGRAAHRLPCPLPPRYVLLALGVMGVTGWAACGPPCPRPRKRKDAGVWVQGSGGCRGDACWSALWHAQQLQYTPKPMLSPTAWHPTPSPATPHQRTLVTRMVASAPRALCISSISFRGYSQITSLHRRSGRARGRGTGNAVGA